MNTIIAILALSFLILIHEIGHFVAAKLSGIKVLEFAIFMGPKLFSIKRGETEYTIRAIPIGGYVKMEGEEENSDDDRAFRNKPVWKRASVSFAGSGMNLLLGFILFFVLISTSLMPANDISTTIESIEADSAADAAGLKSGDIVLKYNNKKVYNLNDLYTFMTLENASQNVYLIERGDEKITMEIDPELLKIDRYMLGFSVASVEGDDSTLVNLVESGSPIDKAGLKKGDRIIMLNDTEVSTITEIQDFLKENGENQVKMKVLRNGENLTLTAVPKRNISYNVYAGYQFAENSETGFLSTIRSSFEWTVSSIRNVYYTVTMLIKDTGNMQYVSGPVGIIGAVSSTIDESRNFKDFLSTILSILALISVNLGIINLLPIPALDGSKLIILGIEKIRGKPLPAEKEAMISLIGFALLIALFIFTIINDIQKLI